MNKLSVRSLGIPNKTHLYDLGAIFTILIFFIAYKWAQ
jgi:hypothetical protein